MWIVIEIVRSVNSNNHSNMFMIWFIELNMTLAVIFRLTVFDWIEHCPAFLLLMKLSRNLFHLFKYFVSAVWLNLSKMNLFINKRKWRKTVYKKINAFLFKRKVHHFQSHDLKLVSHIENALHEITAQERKKETKTFELKSTWIFLFCYPSKAIIDGQNSKSI